MRCLIFVMSVVIYVSACTAKRPITRTVSDTVFVAVSTADDQDPEENIDTVFNQFIASYKQPYMVDSVFRIGGDAFELRLKHYCLMDSAITVPGKYVEMYKLDSFVTHNFVTEISLGRNVKRSCTA